MSSEKQWTKRFFFMQTSRDGDIDILWKRVIPALALIVFLLFGLWPSTVIVPAGARGVKTEWGKVIGTASEGLHFAWWFVGQNIELMNIQIQKAQTTESAASSDLQEVTTEIVVNYQLEPGDVETIYSSLRHDYETRVVRPNMDESLKAATAHFTASELITKRAEAKFLFLNTLRDRLDPFGIHILSVSLTDFQFSPEFTEAIEIANTAKQQAIKALNDLERIKYEASQKVIQADADYNATILHADAAAYATLAEKNAEAEGIRLIVQQISANPEYLEYIRALQWDGKLPYFYGSDAPLPFLILNGTAGP